MELADRYDKDAPKQKRRGLAGGKRARGRDAETPTEIPAKGWKDILLRVKDEIAADHVMLIAAGCAFYGLLAVFPAITALMSITGLLFDPNEIVGAMEGVSSVVPTDVAQIMLDQATAVAGSEAGGLTLGLILGIGLALWSASAGVGALMEGLNVAYDETDERSFVKRKGLTLLLTLGMIVGVLIAAVLIVALPVMLNVMALAPWLETVIAWTKFIPLAILFIVGLAILYRYGPDRDDAELAWITPGALLSLVLWLIMSVGFSFYVSNFGSYNETFGSLAGVIVMLTWMWLSATIVLVGAELNAEMEAQTAHDTTTGPDQPMGQRGAVKADRLGDAQ